jgi:AbrB family looped-hinge helix DNA binding protein
MARWIVRYIDPLGRVTLPKEMRRSLSLKEGDKVDIYFGEKGVICVRPDVETDKSVLANFTEEELMTELYRRQPK